MDGSQVASLVAVMVVVMRRPTAGGDVEAVTDLLVLGDVVTAVGSGGPTSRSRAGGSRRSRPTCRDSRQVRARSWMRPG